MQNKNEQYYLAIRPLAQDTAATEPFLDPLSALTGIDRFTLSQKLTGSALGVLKADHNAGLLGKISEGLAGYGIPSAVIAKSEIAGAKPCPRATSLKAGRDSIKFFSPSNEEIIALHGKEPCLIVLSTMEFESINDKRIKKSVLMPQSSLSPEETLHRIFRNSPVMDVYTGSPGAPESASGAAFRIDGEKFNYTSLGEANKNSACLNFPIIIKEIKRLSTAALLDTGFGGSGLPFFDLDDVKFREDFLELFAVYSRFVFLASERGIFKAMPAKTPTPVKAHLIEELGGIIWAGPVFPVMDAKDRTKESGREAAAALPTPPHGVIIYRPDTPGTWANGAKNFLSSYKNLARSLGPPGLVYPLSFLAALSFALSYLSERPEPLSLGIFSAGALLYMHSFMLLKIKRTIENCPTSKIDTLPMGTVEAVGRAEPKYYLKAPYTFTECVYYSYKIFQEVKAKNGYKNVLKEWGTSAEVPFYIKDDTGRVLITPQGAIVNAGETETISGGGLQRFFGSGAALSGLKIVETVIPAGSPIYVTGFARRLRSSAGETKRSFIEKLRALRKDSRLAENYDKNRDGGISPEEWEEARSCAEEEALAEGLFAKQDSDATAIGEHPTGGLFYISDKKEKDLLKTMAWKIPLFFILGSAGVVWGGFYMLKVLGNKTILFELKNLFP